MNDLNPKNPLEVLQISCLARGSRNVAGRRQAANLRGGAKALRRAGEYLGPTNWLLLIEEGIAKVNATVPIEGNRPAHTA